MMIKYLPQIECQHDAETPEVALHLNCSLYSDQEQCRISYSHDIVAK